METVIPIFPCKSLEEILPFYETLGFAVTYRQDEPYLYGSVQAGGVQLHFASLSVWGARHGVCLVFVPQIGSYHQRYADRLRQRYGRVPTAGLPRITRLRQGQTRFHLFDAAGNVLLYIDQEEREGSYHWSAEALSPIGYALENAAFLRDTYVNDKGAARVLDVALGRHEEAEPVERARALAMRAELAVALGDGERAAAVRAELAGIVLTEEEQVRWAEELGAAERLERWLTEEGESEVNGR